MARPTLQRIFGALVRKHRERLGISQEELAHRARVHPTYVSLLERGQRNPSLNVMTAVAIGLNVSLGAIVTQTERQWTKSGAAKPFEANAR